MANEPRNAFDDPFWAAVRFAGATIAGAGIISAFSARATRFFFQQGWAVTLGVGAGEISNEIVVKSIGGRVVLIYPAVLTGAVFTAAWYVLFGADKLGSGDEPQRQPDLESGRVWLSTFLRDQLPTGIVATISDFGRLTFVMTNVWIIDP